MAKLRHAAALALVGWYLMTPPTVPFPGQVGIRAETLMKSGRWWTDVNAPLSHWQIAESFDSAEDCEDMKSKMVRDFTRHEGADHPSSSYKAAYRVAESQAQCIASDDPRLKGK
ncbi:MAG: hypothetical protein WA005_16675 [Candidatus Binataceae bacterium]